eukprot:354385-Prymnesium_polylepis.1
MSFRSTEEASQTAKTRTYRTYRTIVSHLVNRQSLDQRPPAAEKPENGQFVGTMVGTTAACVTHVVWPMADVVARGGIGRLR